jgi:hypothetical protein
MSFMPSMWKNQSTERAPNVLVVFSDSSLELANLCMGKTLKCGKHMRTQKEMSGLNLQKRENKRCEVVLIY